MENTFDSTKARAAQLEYCKTTASPHFAPYTGKCYRCQRDIYEQIDHGIYKTGKSVESAGSSLITGCPHCSASYCD
jgi:hypothetical protein